MSCVCVCVCVCVTYVHVWYVLCGLHFVSYCLCLCLLYVLVSRSMLVYACVVCVCVCVCLCRSTLIYGLSVLRCVSVGARSLTPVRAASFNVISAAELRKYKKYQPKGKSKPLSVVDCILVVLLVISIVLQVRVHSSLVCTEA
jgi:hypothetical protein